MIFGSHALRECVTEFIDTNNRVLCVVKLAGRLAQMVQASAKPRAANHCPGDTSSTPARVNLSVW